MNWYWVIGWIPTCLAVVGNGLVIYLVTSRRQLHTISNWFVMSLALADFAVGAFVFPSHFICDFAELQCHIKVRDDINVLLIFSSITNLCIMTFDRYVAIVKPLNYAFIMTQKRAVWLIAFAWMTPLLVFFIPVVCASLGIFYMNVKVSVIVWASFFEFLPCLVLLLTTVKISNTARRHCRQTTRLNTQLRYNYPTCRRERVVPSARVIETLVALFLICYALEVFSSLCFFTNLCKSTKELSKVVYFLINVNSAANPIAYALFKRDIRRELQRFNVKREAVPITKL